MRMCPPWHASRGPYRQILQTRSFLCTAFLHIVNPALASQLYHPCHAQVCKANGCCAIEQQKQQKQQKQKQQKQQKQTACGETRVSSLSPDPAGAASADGAVEARLPVILSTPIPAAAACWLSAHVSVLCA